MVRLLHSTYLLEFERRRASPAHIIVAYVNTPHAIVTLTSFTVKSTACRARDSTLPALPVLL